MGIDVADSSGEVESQQEKTVKNMKEMFLVYKVAYSDGREGLCFMPVSRLKDPKKMAAFESDLRKASSWFCAIGQIESRSDGKGNMDLSYISIQALVAAWEESGSPKIYGLGEGPSPRE